MSERAMIIWAEADGETVSRAFIMIDRITIRQKEFYPTIIKKILHWIIFEGVRQDEKDTDLN